MKYLKSIKKFIFVVLIVLFLELTLFNFRFYTTSFSSLDHKVVKVTKENIKVNEKSVKKYSFKINERVKNIKLNIKEKNKNKEITITPKFTDESSRYKYKVLDDAKYMSKYKNSDYIVLNSQKKCLNLLLVLKSSSDFNLKSIELNTWYFDFNFFRVIILILVFTFVVYKNEINCFFDKNSKYKKIPYIIFIILSTGFYIFYSYDYHSLYERSSFNDGMVLKDIYSEFTKSIVSGKISLDFPVENRNKLLKLKNYHDYSERTKDRNLYLFDAAFYKGKYYCYYGVTPVFTVLLPLSLITGEVYYSNVICIVYGTLIMIFLLRIYLRILERFKIKFSYLMEFLIFLTICLTMELFSLRLTPNFYQAVDLCGVFWLLFCFWNILNIKSKVPIRLFLIGLSYGLMVLTRPVYVFYFIPIIIVVFKYLYNNKKINLKNILLFFIPIIVMAIFQMIYNYIRFENIFEFGQTYQLTINDTSSLDFDLGIVINGLLSFVFNPPKLFRYFPYIKYKNAAVNNGNVIYTDMVFGLLWHPFLIILFSIRNRFKNKKYKKIMFYTIILLIICLIQLITDITYAGVIQRYLSDVLPTLTLIALFYWLLYISESKNNESKCDRINLFKKICLVNFIIMLVIVYSCISASLLFVGNKDFDKRIIDYNIKHSIEFFR